MNTTGATVYHAEYGTLTSANSPVTITVPTLTSDRDYAIAYSIANDGSGTINVQLSTDGTNFGDTYPLKSYVIENSDTEQFLAVKKIKLTHTGTDADYVVKLY